MDYLLNEQQQMIIDTAREIANEKIIPVRAELDEQNRFPREILHDIAKADLFSIFVPEEYGGEAIFVPVSMDYQRWGVADLQHSRPDRSQQGRTWSVDFYS